MRALLIYPELPLSFWSLPKALKLRGRKASNPPLGLLTLAALLPRSWEVRLADLNTRSLTEQDWQWAEVLMISAMYIQRPGLQALAREAKSRGKTVVAGGPYPSSLPDAVLEAGCDFVVRGEAENTVPLLLEALRTGQPRVIETPEKPDMTASPIPRFDLLHLRDYDSMIIQTSRGCPFNCEFCDVVHLFGKKFRHKTPQQVMGELEALYRLGVTGNLLICDDNFIGSKEHARAILEALTPWLKSHGAPFTFLTQGSVNLGQDLALVDRMTANNLGGIFIGIESPDLQALEASHKYHNIKNPLVESVNNLKRNGMMVVGSFIIGMDGETRGVGQRICAFIDQTDIPLNMLGLLMAPPHTDLWHRLEREGRLRPDMEIDGGTFSPQNFEPSRPEAEILQEFIDAYDYLYEPSRFLARVYRYFLAMRPTRRTLALARGLPPPPECLPGAKQTWQSRFSDLWAFAIICWRQGIRPPYRRQFWTQLLGMWRQNPSRLPDYVMVCALGDDLFALRKAVRERITALMLEQGLQAPPEDPRCGAAS
jgi:radical SAM superfamily enzyme YgiQ (UPF0313 family)